MNSDERLNLQKMITANDVVDQTTNIRKLQHADKIWQDVQTMALLKKKYDDQIHTDIFKNMILKECNFLFTNYTDIFNKLIKDELNVQILYTFIQELKNIEMGVTDQHEASFKIGKLLKELYIDAALKKADSINKDGEVIKFREGKNISWNQFNPRNATITGL